MLPLDRARWWRVSGLTRRIGYTAGPIESNSEARQLHPLLRDFLAGQLRATETTEVIRQMHRRVGDSIAGIEPLTAAHHYREAGDDASAMHCLSASVIDTMGSGQWGIASDLIERLDG